MLVIDRLTFSSNYYFSEAPGISLLSFPLSLVMFIRITHRTHVYNGNVFAIYGIKLMLIAFLRISKS